MADVRHNMQRGTESAGTRTLLPDDHVHVDSCGLVRCPSLHELVCENEDILTYILGLMDVATLCKVKAADHHLRRLAAAELVSRPIRQLFEHDRCLPGVDVHGLTRRAYMADFATDGPTEMFAGSATPRTVRSPGMHFRVGDVYFHAQTGAFGIVLGWDDRRRAPLTGWGNLSPDRLYAVHYSVFEVHAAFGSAGPGGGEERWRLMWEFGQSRYIIEDNMLSLESIWGYTLPAKSLFPAYLLNAHSGGGSHGIATGLHRMVQELWHIAFPDEPGLHHYFASRFGFLERPKDAALQAANAHGTTFENLREPQRGWGFMPDRALRERYPADGPFSYKSSSGVSKPCPS